MKSRAWLSAVTAVTAVANAYSRWVAVSNIASGTDRTPEAPPEVVLTLCRLLEVLVLITERASRQLLARWAQPSVL